MAYRITFLANDQGAAPVTCTLRPAAASHGLLGTTPFMRRGVEIVDAGQHDLCVSGWKQAGPFGAPDDDVAFLWHVPFGTVDVPSDPTGASNYTPNPDFGQTWDHQLTGDHHTRFRWQSVDARAMDSTATLVLRVRARAEFGAPEALLVTYRPEWDNVGGVGEQLPDVTPTDPPHALELPAIPVTTAWEDHEVPVPVDPLTGTPWTPEQLFRMQWGLRAPETSGRLRVSGFWIDCTFRPAPAPAAATGGAGDARAYDMNHLLVDSFGHYDTADLGGAEQLHASPGGPTGPAGTGVRSHAGYNTPMLEDVFPPGENVVDGAGGYLGDFAPSTKWPGAFGAWAVERPGRGDRDGCLRLTGHQSAVCRWESRQSARSFDHGARIGFAFKTAGSMASDGHLRLLSLFEGGAPWPRPVVTLDVRSDGRLVLNRRGAAGTAGAGPGGWPNLAGAHLVSTLAVPSLADWTYVELNVNPQRAALAAPPPTAPYPNGFAQLRLNGADAGTWTGVETALDFWGSSGAGVLAPGAADTDRAPPADHVALGGDPFYPTPAHSADVWFDDLYIAAPGPPAGASGGSIPQQFHGDAVVGVLYPTGEPGPAYAVPHLQTAVGPSPPEAVADAPFARRRRQLHPGAHGGRGQHPGAAVPGLAPRGGDGRRHRRGPGRAGVPVRGGVHPGRGLGGGRGGLLAAPVHHRHRPRQPPRPPGLPLRLGGAGAVHHHAHGRPGPWGTARRTTPSPWGWTG